jgi:hypothetical protein
MRFALLSFLFFVVVRADFHIANVIGSRNGNTFEACPSAKYYSCANWYLPDKSCAILTEGWPLDDTFFQMSSDLCGYKLNFYWTDGYYWEFYENNGNGEVLGTCYSDNNNGFTSQTCATWGEPIAFLGLTSYPANFGVADFAVCYSSICD